ncbi:MAG: cytochrome c [bacterium]
MKVLVILSLFLGLAMFGPGLLTGGATAYAEQADDPTPAVAEEKPDSAAAEATAEAPAEATAEATDETVEPEVEGSAKKGKYWFKKTCKGCHGADGDGGEVTPVSKTIRQWERYFRKGVHYGEETLGDTFDVEQIIHIRTFLIEHAADSDQPETCG